MFQRRLWTLFLIDFRKMSEQQFWTKYFESLHFHRENKKSTISTQPVDEEFNKAAADEDDNNG